MTTTDAPISRGLVDVASPFFRALLGIAFVAYSASSTIFLGADDLMFLFKQTAKITIGGFADAYWYAAAFAAILFFGEVICGEKYPKTYRLFLGPDAFYTARGVWAGLGGALAVLLETWLPQQAAWVLGYVLAAPASFYFGYLIARWGEELLFGKRRTRAGRGKE